MQESASKTVRIPKMKAKQILILLALGATLGLAACGAQPSVNDAKQPGNGNTPVGSSAPATASSTP